MNSNYDCHCHGWTERRSKVKDGICYSWTECQQCGECWGHDSTKLDPPRMDGGEYMTAGMLPYPDDK